MLKEGDSSDFEHVIIVGPSQAPLSFFENGKQKAQETDATIRTGLKMDNNR